MSRPNPFSSGRSKPNRIFTSYFINSKLIKPRSGFSILHHYSLQALNCSAVLSIFSTSFFYRFLKFFSIVFVRKYSSVISFMLPTCRVKGKENQLILSFFFRRRKKQQIRGINSNYGKADTLLFLWIAVQCHDLYSRWWVNNFLRWLWEFKEWILFTLKKFSCAIGIPWTQLTTCLKKLCPKISPNSDSVNWPNL